MTKREKYALFTMWLKQCDQEIVKLSFSQLCQIIDIPSYAYQYRSAWANSLKPSPFEASWLNAGFVVARVDLLEKWVVFKKGAVKGRSLLLISEPCIAHKFDISSLIECGKKFYDTIKADYNHRFASWEHCYEAFKNNKQNRNDETIDFLSLHLAWYLASWGMLRNSFLFYKDYKIHVPIVRLLLDPKWTSLLDISPEKMSQEFYAELIVELCSEIKNTYIASKVGVPTDTLVTKILLGTIGCVPAYDRYFKKAVSSTGATLQTLNAKSIMTLGQLYLDNIAEFEELRMYCSSRIQYPTAKIIDMCFFEYGNSLERKKK